MASISILYETRENGKIAILKTHAEILHSILKASRLSIDSDIIHNFLSYYF